MNRRIYQRRIKYAGFSLADLCMGLGICAFALTFLLLLVGATNEQANRAKCARNLLNLGKAMAVYASNNHGFYPRTLYDMNTADTPVAFQPAGPEGGAMFAGKSCPVNDVTAPLFHLLISQGVSPTTFICPSTSDKPETFGDGNRNSLCNFTSPESLSYSIANPYANAQGANAGYYYKQSVFSEYSVLAADKNPGTPELLTAKPDDPADKLAQLNSPNHAKAGQNMLFGDGHVDWRQTPFAGIDDDNIFTYGTGDQQGIIGSPVGKGDTILLPTPQMK